MKVLLDEQLSPRIARLLRERGFDAEAVGERADLIEASDEDLLDRASREGRAVVTNNIKDFRPLAARRLADGRGHAGLILLPASRSRCRAAIGTLANSLAGVMHRHPEGLTDAEHWLAMGA